MSQNLLKRLIGQQGKSNLSKTVSSVKDISEYLSDAIELAKESDYLTAIARAAPWAGIAVGALGEAVPLVKFAAKLFTDLTKETDPEALGHLACTLAYQRAIEETVKSMEVPIVSNPETKDIKNRLAALEPSVDVDIGTLSFENALGHEFVSKADDVLKAYAEMVGYNKEQTRRLLGGVHVRFVSTLKTLLSDGSLKDRFGPFADLMRFESDERQAYKALSDHAAYQRWLFEEAPVFKTEPYSLADIYVNTECGSLTWGDIKKGADPFSEQNGGRMTMLDTVIELMGDPTFKEAIIIQGAGGAGKSSLTLKLCSELLSQGLRPIRIRLGDLRLDQEISTALPNAIRLGDEDFPTSSLRSAPDDLFLGGSIFKERVPFGSDEICPYVLILDDWNGISIAAATTLLGQIRSEYLNYRQRVRLILTGRPSRDVSGFFRERTRVLTVRPLKPRDLRTFVDTLRQVLVKVPAPVSDFEHRSMADVEIFKPILDDYKEDFRETLNRDFQGLIPEEVREIISDGEDKTIEISTRVRPADRRSMAVLGFPMLAHVTIDLISQWPGDPNELITNPTSIYRSLVDRTIEQSSKGPEDASDSADQVRLSGTELRTLLWRTAAAMTVLGKERLSHSELKLRLDLDDLQGPTTEAKKENLLSGLMVSSFIRESDLGAEFVHPSFREYFFAEALVEILKEFGRRQAPGMPERIVYWKEFSDDDTRYELTRKLSEHLAPQWLTPDVTAHLEQLLKWEIDRSSEKADPKALGNSTQSLSPEQWTSVRDGLADVWDWWAEGVHLRPQPVRSAAGYYTLRDPPYVHELIKTSKARDVQQERLPESPDRTVTVDAHLGDGLIRICSLIHCLLAIKEGWLIPPPDSDRWAADLWEGVSPIGKGPRKCQSSVTQGDRSWVFFAPTQEDPHFFDNYAHRINAAGWRPSGPFPLGINLSGIDLRAAIISIPFLADPTVAATIWTYANLSHVKAAGSCLPLHEFIEVYGKSIDLRSSYLVGTDFLRANLELADFTGSSCLYAIFEEAKLRNAFLRRTDLENSSFVNADVQGADFSNVRINKETSFEGTENMETAKNLLKALQQVGSTTED